MRRHMSDSVIPISDEQAKLGQKALEVLQGFGGFLREILGTVPEDLVGYLGGDLLKVRRAENLARILEKARERLRARRVEGPEPASLSLALPILVAGADESRDELQDLWARLLAATADPARVKSFRSAFIDVVKKMDPLDAAGLQAAHGAGGFISHETRNGFAIQLHASRDEVDVSVDNLLKLGLVVLASPPNGGISAFGREFLRTVSN
jgi:abortive infection alpha-like protein